jgi:hypothetical protein
MKKFELNWKIYKLRVVIVSLIIIYFTSIISGCKNLPTIDVDSTEQLDVNQTQVLPTLRVEKTREPTPTPTSEPKSTTNASDQTFISYSFFVDYDYKIQTLSVNEEISFQNFTGKDLSELRLIVPPNQTFGVFNLKTIEVEESEKLISYSLNGIELVLVLEHPLVNNEPIKILINFVLVLPQKHGLLGYTQLQTNISDWYPFIPPYDEETGWVINQPAAVGEYLTYDKAKLNLEINITGSSDLQIASSSPLILDSNGTYSGSVAARNFTWSVSERYITLSRAYGDVLVRAFVFSGDQESGWAAITATGQALTCFKDLFGAPYTHKTLTIVDILNRMTELQRTTSHYSLFMRLLTNGGMATWETTRRWNRGWMRH